MNDTAWDNYGVSSGNPSCRDCMVHSGYEATAVDHTFSSFGGMWGTVKAMVFNRYTSPAAARNLEAERDKPHGPEVHLVSLGVDVKALRDAQARRRSAQTMDVA